MLTDGKQGFSLLELLVVMAVLGIIMVPMINAFSQSFQATRIARMRQTGTMLAQNCLAQLRSTVEYSNIPTGNTSVSCDGSTTGNSRYQFGSNYPEFSYETSAEQMANTGGGLDLKLVRIRVYFPGGFTQGERCISTTSCNSWDFTTFVALR